MWESGEGDRTKRKCLILVLCGLPASGKSSLAGILQGKFFNSSLDDCLKSKVPPTNIYHISYDDLMPPDLEKELIQQLSIDEELCTNNWKTYRRAIFNCTERAVSNLMCLETNSIPIVEVPEELNNHYAAMLQDGPASADQDVVHIFIIDDNMYYAGMRYEYYKLAKKYGISFAEVYMACAVTEAQRRNAARTYPVPEEVIATMATRIEPPDKSSLWEKHSVMLNGEEDLVPQLDLIVDLICSSLDEPVKDYLAELEVQRQESRSETLASTMHQIDQVLRRVVADAMKDAKEITMSSDDIKILSGKLRQLKPEILQQFKSGALKLTEDELSEGFQSSSKRSLFQRLKLIVQERL